MQVAEMKIYLSGLACLLLAVGVTGQEFSVLVLGDWGIGSTEQRDVAAAMNAWAAQNNPQFILTTGDNFYQDGITGASDPRLENYWNQVYTGNNIRNLRWEVTVGNHDYSPSGSRREWNQVAFTNIDPTGRWHLPALNHSFYRSSPLGEIHFVIIDSQGIRIGENNPDQMLQWLRTELQGSRGAMKIVVGHHPIYSAGGTGPIDRVLEAQVLSLMEQHGVDIYIAGHEHNMQHQRNISTTNDYLEQVVSGGGGAELHSENPVNRGILEALGITTSAFFRTHGFTGLTVVNNELRLEYRNSQNELIYDLRKPPRTPSRSVPVQAWKNRHTKRYI